MKKNFFLTLLLAVVALFSIETSTAQAPVDSPEQAITGLLNRIGGNGAANKFEIVIDANLAENGKDVFIIAPGSGKPCIKGNNQLSVATGINWYLNHYAHINLTWNNLTTDLSAVTLPVPTSEEKHVSNAKYRYDFNTCTFSYSMAFWTWERWQQEIDWMALHGINAPLNLVGLDVVTRKFLRELGVSESDIDAYIAGPGFIAWFAMNNLEGWGGTINATDVTMNGNPDWWYTRQEQLCRNMLQRMRELGMQPVIPGYSGQVPNCITKYNISGFSSGDVINSGTWAGGYTRPDIVKPDTESYRTLAAVYYKHLHEVMGVSELYSIDPFHEGGLPQWDKNKDGEITKDTDANGNLVDPYITNGECYPPIMVELDNCFNNVSQEDKTKNNVDEQPKWIIQYWQNIPQSGAFSAMESYGDRFIGLDLFSDAPGKAKWNTDYYKGRPYIFCMLHNFGGRSGMHGRLESTMNDYFSALAKGNNCQGIGATPEGTETNPILYDMLFELPWMDVNNRPTADAWLAEYAYSRYGVKNDNALAALQNLKKSVWACPTDQQGTSEAVILARPDWSISSVSSWSTSAIYWDTQDVLLAADQLSSISDLIRTADGIANYNYDFIDVVRQAMVDYAAQLLPLINAARGNDAEYTRLYQLYLQLMLDLDKMLSYDENFKLERWTSLARNIANEVDGTTENDRRWLEWNARTQVTVWSKGNTDLHDYSNRCWAGLIKDFHYKRWEKFFTTNGGSFSGGWFDGFEYPWTVDFTNYNYSTVTIPNDMTATAKAKQTFGNYFGRVKGATKNYIFPMGVTTSATASDVIPEVYRGKTVELPLIIGKNVTISSVWIDLNNDGAASDSENLAVSDGNKVAIAADAAIGKTTAKVTYSDGTVITFNIALIEDITENRTVTAVAGANGSVAIEGTNELSITTTEAVKITATANTGYNFENWTKGGEVVSNDNPFIYYGKEEATFTANFIQDKWGVVACNGSFSGDIASSAQFIHNLTFAYYNREAETIFETTTAPTEIFNTIPQIVNVPQGASFDVEYNNGNSDGLKYCYFRAFIDLNQDGDFDDEGELLKEIGTNGAANTAVCSNKINVLLPYDIPLGITHMRLRFDGAWDNSEKPSALGAKAASIRPVYEIIINVTDFSDKAAHITVATNSEEWGTVKVWTDETPDGSTRTEWDVTKGVPFFIAAEKTSEDVEFLGWYDQYGRLVTENLEHTMYAREDATYTARFRKFLEIDGWQIEYRTQPGKDVVVGSALANGVKPEAGKKYYIYAPTNYNSVSATRYLYDNNGTLATNTTAAGNNYIWTCIVNNDGTYSFQNASGNYLANNGSYHLSIGATAAKYALEDPTTAGVAIKNEASYTGGKYMVTKHDGSAFNRNGSKTNGEWCSDYVFTEVSTPDVIVFTKVRQNGVNDLVIPATVEVLGEQLTIAGFDNDLFNNNNDLWSITLPSTMEFLGNNVIFESSLKGENTPVNNSDNSPSELTQVIDLKGLVLKNSEPWKIEIKYSSDGVSSYNQWGSFLLSPGSTWGGAELLYLTTAKQDSRGWHLRSPASGLGDDYFKEHTIGKVSNFTVTLENKGTGKAVIAVTNSEGATQTSTEFAFTVDNISAFCARIPKGLDITSFKIMDKEVVNPFSGCRNLDKIAIDGTCENYYVANDGGLYNSSDVLVCMPEGKEKGADSRALAALIEQMEELTAQVGTYNPTGKATAVDINNTEGSPYYIYSNATIAEGKIEYLWDNSSESNSYIHTTWSENSADGLHHYLRVYLGEDPELNNFSFSYITRDNGNEERPKQITVSGCNTVDGVYEEIVVLTDLPNGRKTTYNSPEAYDVKGYKYLRFMVDDTYRDLGNSGHKAYSMAEFDLYKMTSTADVYSYLEAGITNEQAATGYDAMLDAQAVYDYGTTAAEMQDAKTALQSAYDTLKALLEAAIPVKLTTDEANPVLYKIFIKRTEDVTVLKYDEPSGMVAVENKADDSSWQAWYFMSGTNGGVTIHPYNGDGKVLSADNTGNSPAKVWAVEKGEKAFYEWKFVTRADGYYNIQVYDGSNYFSNNGGTGNKMGFWSGSPESDTGSLFKFVEAEFGNDNARFYQMCDIKATMTTDGTNIYGGTSVGLYTGGKEYREAYTAAADLEATGNTSASDDCYTTYKALRAANDVLAYNEADLAKVYYIVSTATNGYCKGQYVHTYTEVQPSHNNYDHKDLVYHNFNNITTKTLAAFQFETTATQGEYKMKNLHTGLYVKSFAKNADHLGTEAEAQVVKIAGIADGQVTLKIGNADPMHAQDDNDCIVGWGASVGNASTWTINEVTDLAQLDYYFTVPASGVATLNLAFNAVLPQGVTAYEITGVRENGAGVPGYEMAQVAAAGEVLAKNTPVLIVANEGTHTFALTLSDENVKTVQGTMMNGTVWQTTVSEGETKHYQPVTEEGIVVLKPVEYTDGACTMVANSAWVETTVDAESIKPYEEAVEDRFAGVYKITLETYYDDEYKEAQDKPNLFVAYNEKKDDHSTVGYKMLVTGDNATTDAEADMYFTITEKDGGYSFQAQGMYLKKQQDWVNQWRHSLFSENEDEAGVYLFEETNEPGILNIKGNDGNNPYLNAWDTGDVFIIGNNQAGMSAGFSFTPVTTYTLKVPEGGVTTLCLPFNVVLPAGVEAYDVNVVTEEGKCKYNLTQIATTNNVLAKNTPVVIMATAGNYTLNITMDDTDADGSVDGSVLCGKYWERNLAAGANNYQLAVTADGVVFNRVDIATTVAANTAWMKLSDDKGAVIYNEFTEIPEIPDAPALLTDGGVYRIKGRLSNGNFRTVYTNGVGNSLRWTSKEKNDATTLFVVQATVNGFKLVSALGDGLWNNDHALDEDGVELTLLDGTVNGTYAIRGNDKRIFSAFGLGEENNLNQYSGGDVKVDTTETTDFIFEKITDEKELAKVAFTKRIHKGNHFATLFLPYNVEVPEGVAAYTATIYDKDKDENGAEKVGYISLTEVENGIIPARTAVILSREENAAIGEFSFKYTTEAGSNYDDNLFGGRVTPGYVGSDNLNNGDIYYLLLNLDSKGEALYKVYREYYQNGAYAGENNGGYIKCDANKGYMKLNVALGASSSYIFRINGATGIEELEGEDSEEKVIYDLQGRKLTEITKPGFYIVNGEKVFVK